MKAHLTRLGIVPLCLAVAFAVFAQDDALLQDTNAVLNSVQIDVDGSFQERPKETAADRMAKMRKKLEEQNEQMVQKKIEDMRIKEEQKLTNKLRSAFHGGGLEDEVSSTQSAPQKIEKVQPVVEEEKSGKVIPYFGVANINGKGIDFESKIAAGVGVESMVHERFSFGVGINFTKVSVVDVSNSTGANPYLYPINPYPNYFNEGRDMSYSRLGLEINSKFFIVPRSKIRPFVGLGLGYNRTKLKYDDQQKNVGFYDPYYSNNFSLGDEEYSNSFVTGSVQAGAEVNFSDTIGMVLDFRYTKALNADKESGNIAGLYKSPDQANLDDVGVRIDDASFMSINAGLLIRF